MRDRYVDLGQEIVDEVIRARSMFPQPNALLAALMEEVGELAEALLEKDTDEIRKEAVQVAAMAIRIATEGDPTLDTHRQQQGLLPSRTLDQEVDNE